MIRSLCETNFKEEPLASMLEFVLSSVVHYKNWHEDLFLKRGLKVKILQIRAFNNDKK